MTTSPLALPLHSHPLPSKDRSGLSSYAIHLLDRITREGLGADVHHSVEAPGRTASDEACPWCPDQPFACSILVHSDRETAECCHDCVPAVMEHLADHGAHPETVTLDVELPAPLAYGWDRLLADLSAGLDLDQWSGRVTLAARLVRAVDVPTLRSLAAWLDPATTAAALPDRQAMRIADAWAARPAELAAVTA